MRVWLFGLLVLLAPGVQAQPMSGGWGEAGAFATVWTAEELQAAGVARWSDLFGLLSGWHTTSLDGFTVSASPRGLAPPGAAWAVYVDGQPVEVATLGTAHLALVPVPLSAVAEVRIRHVPAVVGGRYVPAGAIEVWTAPPERGLHAGARVAAGNETGDPGPYRYTRFATPNIDRTGPAASAHVSASSGRLFASGWGRTDEHHVTDEQLLDRVRLLYESPLPPRQMLRGAGLRAGTRSPALRIVAAFSRLDDFAFFDPLGLEVPRRQHHLHVGASGAAAPARTLRLRYRLAFTQSDLDPLPNARGYFFDWRGDHVRGGLEADLQLGRLLLSAGGGADVTLARTTPLLPDRSILVPTGFVRTAAPGRRGSLGLTAAAAFSPTRIGLKALLDGWLPTGTLHGVALHASYARGLPEEQPTYVTWALRGYRPGLAADTDLAVPPYLPLDATVTTDLAWTYGRGGPFSVTAAALWREFRFQLLPDVRRAVDADGLSVPGAVAAYQFDGGGRVLGARASLDVRLGPVRQMAHYLYLRPHAGGLAFWRLWRPVPWHQLDATTHLRPNGRFGLFARLRITSASLWPTYAGVAEPPSGRYPSRLPPLVVLDVTAQKRFWADHLRTSLSLRNALNRPERTHPAGAITRLTLFVQAELYF